MSCDLAGSEAQFSLSFFTIPTFYQPFPSLPVVPHAPLHFLAMHLPYCMFRVVLSWAFPSVVIPRPRRNPLLPRTAASHSWLSAPAPLLCSCHSCTTAINSPRRNSRQCHWFPGCAGKPGEGREDQRVLVKPATRNINTSVLCDVLSFRDCSAQWMLRCVELGASGAGRQELGESAAA